MKHSKIALIGMMGSGKTTIANILAGHSGAKVFDMDDIFEKTNNISIKEYFKKYGEESFRAKETELLKELASKENFILSTGGGIVLSEENRKILFNSDIFTIYLSANTETIYERIKHDTSRPLLMVDNPKGEIEKILNQRTIYYSMANKTILTDNKSVEKIAEEIQWIL